MQAGDQEVTDEVLAGQARAGSLECFEVLVRRYAGRLLRFIKQRTPNHQDAEDIVQTTFMAAYRGLSRFDERRPFAPWLFTIAARQAISHARRRRDFDPLPEAHERAVAPSNPPAHEPGALWALARGRLPEAQFTALWLKYAEDFSVADIARAMGRTQVHVRVLLHRGRRLLAQALRQQEDGDSSRAGRTT